MLPGKVFLEGITNTFSNTERSNSGKAAYKLNLSLNDIYYDELKQYHTKYICVSSNDVLSLELYSNSHCLGVAAVPDLYKLILDNRTIDVKLKPKDPTDAELNIRLNFQTVSSYRRKSPGKAKNEEQKRIE